MKTGCVLISLLLGSATAQGQVLPKFEPGHKETTADSLISGMEAGQAMREREQQMKLQREQAERERQQFEIKQRARQASARAEIAEQETRQQAAHDAQAKAVTNSKAVHAKFQPEQLGNGEDMQALYADDPIPAKEREKMGLSNLTKVENGRLQTYLREKLSMSYARGFAKGQIAAGESRPTATALIKNSVYGGDGKGHWIDKNIDHGAMLLLEDGSLWEVEPLDKLDALLWLSTTSVFIRPSDKGSPGYDYLIVNTDDGEKVHAKFLGTK